MNFLRRTIIIIGLILTVFCGAFLSVVSVRNDLPVGIMNMLDGRWLDMTCIVEDIPLAYAKSLGATTVFGRIKGVTVDTVLRTEYGQLDTIQDSQGIEELEYSYKGYFVDYQESAKMFAAYDDTPRKGKWIDGPNQICLSQTIANHKAFTQKLTVGDSVTVGDREFEVVGIFYLTDMLDTHNSLLNYAHFYLSLDDGADVTLNEAYLTCANAQTLLSIYEQTSRARYNARSAARISEKEINRYQYDIIDDIELVKAFFLAVELLLGMIIFFILFSLMSIFYRQRKVNICRMKLLGARNSTITFIYTFITVLMILCAVMVGAALSLLFNKWYMGLCADVFGCDFSSTFNVIAPIILFFALTAVTILIFLRFHRKIRNTTVAREVRVE
ncbi:MAG: ABC transporter permease [Clostridiales bacterium]|nr:ABC transporter permease [Clostridiales bacterium]